MPTMAFWMAGNRAAAPDSKTGFFHSANSEIDGFVKITGDYSYFVTLIDDGIIDQEPTIVDTLRSSSYTVWL